MSTFKYKVENLNGKLISDTLSASSKKEAESFLLDRKYKVLYIAEEKESKQQLNFSFSKGFSLREKIALCKYISLLINAGLPLGEAFDMLIAESKNPVVKKILQEVSLSLSQGQSLLSCFGKYPEHFDEVFLAMVKTGETSGTLAKSFDYLGKQYKQEDFLKQKVTSALIYPFVIVGLMFGIGILMFTFVLPRMAKAFLKLDVDLPLPTKIMLETSLFFEKNMILLFLILGGIIVSGIIFMKSKVGIKVVNNIVLKIPVVSMVFLEYNLARFTQSLSALLQSGVPIIESLEIATKSLSSNKREQIAKSFKEKIGQGLPLATVFTEEKIFPPLMNQMISIGERTGNLDKILVDLSDFYQEEVENSLKNLVALLEPVLMIIIGIAVGIMVLAIISPMYSLIGKIQPK